MRVRIHRTWEWKCLVPLSEMMFGGDNPLTLVPTDTLEYCVASYGNLYVWEPIPLVEDPKPEHPRDKLFKKETQQYLESIDFEKLKRIVGDPTQCVTGTVDPNILIQNKNEQQN